MDRSGGGVDIVAQMPEWGIQAQEFRGYGWAAPDTRTSGPAGAADPASFISVDDDFAGIVGGLEIDEDIHEAGIVGAGSWSREEWGNWAGGVAEKREHSDMILPRRLLRS